MNFARSAAIVLALGVVPATVTGGVAGAAAAEEPVNTSKPTIAGTPRQGQTLTASSGTWSGRTPITFEYRWRRCNSNGHDCDGIGVRTQSYTLRAADVGHRMQVRVIAKNADGQTQSDSDATAVVAASAAPVNRNRPKIEGTAREGQTLRATNGAWSGAGEISFAYQWVRCNAVGADCASISDATRRTYTLARVDVGHTLRVAVTATNSAGSSQALSDQTPVVAARGSAPANTRRPFVTGNPMVGQQLTVDEGSWSGDRPLQFTYAWLRCDSSGTRCQTIGGARARTYKPVNADLGHRLRALVTATNSFGSAAALSDAVGPVTGLPVANSLPTISGNLRVGGTLTASLGKWTSPLPLTFFFQWARCDATGANCLVIPGATRQTYVVVAADAGHRLIVQIKAQNSIGATFANSRPTAVVAGVAPPPPPPPGRGCVSISSVSLPERLVIDRAAYTPSRITSRSEPLVARFHVTTTRGRCVSGALVYAVGVPFNRLSRAPETATDGAGWATVTFAILPTFSLRRGNLVVIFVRARKPGESVLAGVSTRRLVAVRVG